GASTSSRITYTLRMVPLMPRNGLSLAIQTRLLTGKMKFSTNFYGKYVIPAQSGYTDLLASFFFAHKMIPVVRRAEVALFGCSGKPTRLSCCAACTPGTRFKKPNHQESF